jgi:hypothetical protein
MALVKKILKQSAQEVIVKWTGSGADTLTLASLISANQTLLGTPVPAAVITGAVASLDTAGACTVTRNAVEVLHVHDNFSIRSEEFGSFDENATFDIAVNLATIGTLILKIKKTQGYSAT